MAFSSMLLGELRTQPAVVSLWRVSLSKRLFHAFFPYRSSVSSPPFTSNSQTSIPRLPCLRRPPHRTYKSFPGGQPSRPRNPTSVPYTLLTLCTSIYLLSYYARTLAPNLLPLLDAHAVCSLSNLRQGRYYTLLTSSFTHFSLMHLAFNMYGLYTLGPLICATFGPGGFLALWVGGALSCGAAQLGWEYWSQQTEQARSYARAVEGQRQGWRRPEEMRETKSVGASGSILGMFTLFGCMMPAHKIMIFPLPVPVAAWVGVGVFAVGSAYCMVEQVLPMIGHAGHLGGMGFGVLYWAVRARRKVGKVGRF